MRLDQHAVRSPTTPTRCSAQRRPETSSDARPAAATHRDGKQSRSCDSASIAGLPRSRRSKELWVPGEGSRAD